MDYIILIICCMVLSYLYCNYFKYHGPAYAYSKIIGKLFKLGLSGDRFKIAEKKLQFFIKEVYSKSMNYEEAALRFYTMEFIRGANVADDSKVFPLASYFQGIETITSWTTDKKISQEASRSARTALCSLMMELAGCMEKGDDRYKLELMILDACKKADESS